ncbi:hypothetical protein R3P38DRAFT_2947733 [Favolaschia claudopus]|uniref:Uncharacterized protein n=1 Tax=Favolaschia claudopus TaxID=2862362 RepID=A0AAW0BIJ5_9AGAR
MPNVRKRSRTTKTAQIHSKKDAAAIKYSHLSRPEVFAPALVQEPSSIVLITLLEAAKGTAGSSFPAPQKEATWNTVLSTPGYRKHLYLKGILEFDWTVVSVIFDLTEGLADGSPFRHTEFVTEALANEHVIRALLITSSPLADHLNVAASSLKVVWFTLLGAFHQETGGGEDFQDWILDVFEPLVRLAMKTYTEGGSPDSPIRTIEPTTCNPNRRHDGGELALLGRIRQYQLARRPIKLRRIPARPSTSDQEESDEDTKTLREIESVPVFCAQGSPAATKQLDQFLYTVGYVPSPPLILSHDLPH